MITNCPECKSSLIRDEYSVRCSNLNCKYHEKMTEKFLNRLIFLIKQHEEFIKFENENN